jgi:hypothetical protein
MLLSFLDKGSFRYSFSSPLILRKIDSPIRTTAPKGRFLKATASVNIKLSDLREKVSGKPETLHPEAPSPRAMLGEGAAEGRTDANSNDKNADHYSHIQWSFLK